MNRFLRIVYALVLLCSAGALAFFAPRGVETDLFAAVGENAVPPILRDLNAQSGARIRVLSLDPELTRQLRALYPFDPPLNPTNFYEVIRTKGAGLLTAKTRTLIREAEYEKIRRSVKRRDYTSVGLFSKEDDPYYFRHDFVMALKSLKPDLPEGAEILTGTVPPEKGTVPLASLIDLARAHPDKIYLSGAPFHTYLATEKTKREVTILGVISLIGVFLFGFLLFRSVRFLLPMGLLLAAGFHVASAAVFALPGRPHALTFLFGTSLIGLGVDYCYHALANKKGGLSPFSGGLSPFHRKLTVAFVSTILVFLPLFVSGIGVLVEMALFTIVGLGVIYWGVIAWFSR